MRIKTIRLKNGYKRFFDLTIDLGIAPKKIIALVGPNGSGKSSVFDGMTFLSGAHQQIGSTGRKDMSFYSMLGNEIRHDDIEIAFDTNENFQQARNRKKESSAENTIFNFRNSYRYNSDLNITNLSTIPDIKINQSGASSSIDLDNIMALNYQRLYVYINDYRKRNDLTDKQANERVIGFLNTILTNCLGLTVSDIGEITSGRGTLYFKKANQPREFSFNVLSAGEKEVVDILLDIFLKIGEYSESIYIIDEPELHINTAIQKKLLIEIEKLIPETSQLWIATHSIGFLNALQKDLNEKSDIIDFYGDLSTKKMVITPMVKTRQNWQKLFKTALEDLTGLIAPELIIYCEGHKLPGSSGEELGLDADIYNEVFSEEFPNALFVSSGGSTEPDKYGAVALVVLNKAFKDVNLLILKDKDINSDGAPTTDSQRSQFLQQNPSLHRMLDRKEIENYLFDYEIISKLFPAVDKQKYELLIPDINDDVKSKAKDLMILCNITERGINKEKFKRNLAKGITKDTSIYNELKKAIF